MDLKFIPLQVMYGPVGSPAPQLGTQTTEESSLGILRFRYPCQKADIHQIYAPRARESAFKTPSQVQATFRGSEDQRGSVSHPGHTAAGRLSPPCNPRAQP